MCIQHRVCSWILVPIRSFEAFREVPSATLASTRIPTEEFLGGLINKPKEIKKKTSVAPKIVFFMKFFGGGSSTKTERVI